MNKANKDFGVMAARSAEKIKAISFVCLFQLSTLILAGCASHQAPAANARAPITSELDLDDLSIVAEAIDKSLLESGLLGKTPSQPAVLAFGSFVNNTSHASQTTL